MKEVYLEIHFGFMILVNLPYYDAARPGKVVHRPQTNFRNHLVRTATPDRIHNHPSAIVFIETLTKLRLPISRAPSIYYNVVNLVYTHY